MSKKSKRLLSAFCAFIVFVSSYASFIIPFQVSADTSTTAPVLDLENDVKYFGRTYSENGKRYISWSNSGFQFTFYGTGAQATLQASLNTPGSATQQAYINVYVDGVLHKDGINVPESESTVTLASGLNKGVHTIKVLKRTSSHFSMVTLSKIQLDAGSEIRETQKEFERKMLFIGDNLTAGYSSLQATYITSDPGTAKEDSTVSYTALAADYFGAENMTVALTHEGGRGILQNGNKSTNDTAPQFFEYLDYRTKKTVQYDHSQYDPDIIVINLGSYEYESGVVTVAQFKPACKDFILQVRKAYPDATILYTYGIVNTGYSSTISDVIKELNNGGDNNIFYRSLSTIASNDGRGYNKHPSTSSHVKYSKELIAAVEDIMGWTGADTPGNPVSSDVPVDTLYQPFEQTDISVMSYNVLSHDSKTYEAYGSRMAKVVTMIKAYDPDVIGLQEVSVPYDTYTHDWPGYLSSNCTEYASVRLDTQANNSGLMRIGNGLMIMYKKDKFELLSSGYQQYKTYTETNSNYGSKTYTVTDTSRWFHWVQLKDKTTGRTFYLYNTHLTVNGNTPEADRISQCRILAQHIVKTNSLSAAPFFITGDFNTDFDAGDGALEKLTNYNKKDDGASAVALFNDAASVADYTRFADRTGTLDHVFVANRYVDVKEFHVAAEGVDGRRTSDHSPHIAYCNFKPHTTGGLTTGLDDSGKVFTASTASSSYTFNFSLGTSTSYSIYDENGNAVSGTTVTLSKRTNRFGLYFKDGKGNYVATIQAVITNTSVAEPTLTANAVNSYFANGAYHVLVSGNSVNISASNGTFYTNPYASLRSAASLSLTAVPSGRIVYYLKTSAGDIYPVYIYKQTTTADNSVIYVDDDIATGENNEQVAFFDGKNVIFLTRGTNGFATVSEAATKANATSGSKVLFAPGKYDSNDVKFTNSVTLLGNNHDTSAVDIKAPNWSMAGRKAETVINGGLIFEATSNISVTVKGFTIEGTSTNGPIFINDTTSAVATRATHVQTLDIQNNIITGGGNGSSSTYASAISAYSGAKIAGLIRNNYFRAVLNQDALGDNGKTRGIVAKNTDSLVIDYNYFIGYSVLFNFTDEVSTSVAGNSIYSVIGNRMEHCGTAQNYIKGITSATSANISYINNDFVRCGGTHYEYSIYFNFTQNSLGNDCSRININVIGNRFSDCYRSLQFTRTSAAAQTGNLAEATVRVNKNNFINPTEGSWKKYFRSIDMSFCVVGATANGTISPEKWNFGENHFESPFLVTEYNDLQNYYDNNIYELNYIRYYSTESAGSDSKSFIISADHFKAISTTANSAVGAFSGASTATSDSYELNFDNDIKDMSIIKGVSAFNEKFTHSVANNSSKISITNELAAKMEGFAQFYSDNRWTGENQISLDLKMDSTANDFAGFFIKYGKENLSGSSANSVFYSNDGARGDSANSTTGTTGIGFSFRTINNVQCIEVFVKYLNSSGKIAVSGQYFYDVVDNLEDFNTYTVTDDGAGTINFFANGNLFATLICSNAKVPTRNTSYKETYYNDVTIKDKEGKTLATVSDALVSTESALAFGTRNEALEIDNMIIVGEIDESLGKDPYEFKIDGMQLSLSNEISVRFIVNSENFDNAGYTRPTVTATFGNNTYQLQGSTATVSDIPCYVFIFENVSPHMMGDTISATLSAELNGETVQSEPVTTSIAQYAYTQLINTTDAKLRTLLVDMLHYGAKAQLYTRHNKAYLVDADLTSEQASWGTQTMRELTSIASISDYDGTVEWLGMGLNLQNKVNIQGTFTVPSTTGLKVNVTDASGNVINVINENELTIESSDGVLTVSFIYDKLSVNQMSKTVKFTVFNSQGTKISGTITYSIESYAQRNQNSANSALVNLLNSMIIYGDSAKAYAG